MGTSTTSRPEQIEGERGRRAGRRLLARLRALRVPGRAAAVPRATRTSRSSSRTSRRSRRCRARAAALPAALDAVIAAALAKEPERRYASCRELVRAALAVAADDASRTLADLAARTAAGRDALSEAEAELAGTVIDLRSVRQQARAFADPLPAARAAALNAIARSRGSRATSRPMPSSSSVGSGWSPSSSLASPARACSASSGRPAAASRPSCARGCSPALADDALPGSDRWRHLCCGPASTRWTRSGRARARARRTRRRRAGRAARRRPPPAGGRPARGALHRLRRTTSAPRSSTRWSDAAERTRAVVVVACGPTTTAGRPPIPRWPSCGRQQPPGRRRCRRGAATGDRAARPRVGVRVEPGLADALIADVGASRARCRCCRPRCSSSGSSGGTGR